MEKNLAKNAKKNPKAFYSYMKKKTSNKGTVGPFKIPDGKLEVDDREMTEILNKQFCNMFTKEDLAHMPDVETLFHGEEGLSTVTFTAEKVTLKLKKLKPTSAPGPDRVWTKILHDLAEVLGEPLAIIYTKLMEQRAVPDIWLKSFVCPIFKKGTKSDPGNYRPVYKQHKVRHRMDIWF